MRSSDRDKLLIIFMQLCATLVHIRLIIMLGHLGQGRVTGTESSGLNTN